MQITEAIRTYLLAQGSLSAIIGTKLAPERVDMDTPAPFVTYHVEIREADVTMERESRTLQATFDFTAISTSYDQVFTIAELLRTLLNYVSGTEGGTGGVFVEDVEFIETIGGYADARTAELGEFGALSRFVVTYRP